MVSQPRIGCFHGIELTAVQSAPPKNTAVVMPFTADVESAMHVDAKISASMTAIARVNAGLTSNAMYARVASIETVTNFSFQTPTVLAQQSR